MHTHAAHFPVLMSAAQPDNGPTSAGIAFSNDKVLQSRVFAYQVSVAHVPGNHHLLLVRLQPKCSMTIMFCALCRMRSGTG